MKKVLLLSLLFICAGVTTAQETKLSKKEKKELAAKANLEKTKALLSTKNYEFTGTFMFPQSGQRVSMLTPPNNLIIKDSMVASNLPYIGTKQFAGRDNGMIFEGALSSYTMEVVEKKNKIKVSFSCKDGTETFRFELDIAPDGYTNVIATSNRRNTISYTGNITAIKK
jgi:hypothetical protein